MFYDLFEREGGKGICKRCGIEVTFATDSAQHIHRCQEREIKWKPPTHTLENEWGINQIRPYQKHPTNKWTSGYIDVYEVLFNHRKHVPIALLEFGTYFGASMDYFNEYFTHPDTKIVGFDHASPTWWRNEHGLPEYPCPERVSLVKGDQRIPEDVNKLIEEHGPFDFVIDDGHHNWPYPTEDVFYTVWPHVNEGGLYIIEDVGDDKIMHLIDEVVVDNEGKGFSIRGGNVFGGAGVDSGFVIIQKTKNRIAGLDEVLTED